MSDLSQYEIKDVEGLERGLDIGSGSYGTVCEVRVEGLPCIAKRLHNVLLDNRQVDRKQIKALLERFLNECVLLSRLRHPNIVRFVGVHVYKPNRRVSSGFNTLIMERMHTDLDKVLKSTTSISLSTKLAILVDVSYGLLYLHSQSPPIIHRDLTAPNILLSADMRAKIADLGESKMLDPSALYTQTACPGTLAYMPPEALTATPEYSDKLDVFSFGHLALYTINQEWPQPFELIPEQYRTVKKGTVQVSRRRIALDRMGEDHCLYVLVTHCLHDNPAKRPKATDINSTLEKLRAHHDSTQSNPQSLDFKDHIYEEIVTSSQQSQATKLKKENQKLKREKESLEKALHYMEVQFDQYKRKTLALHNERRRGSPKSASQLETVRHRNTVSHSSVPAQPDSHVRSCTKTKLGQDGSWKGRSFSTIEYQHGGLSGERDARPHSIAVVDHDQSYRVYQRLSEEECSDEEEILMASGGGLDFEKSVDKSKTSQARLGMPQSSHHIPHSDHSEDSQFRPFSPFFHSPSHSSILGSLPGPPSLEPDQQ